MSPEQVLADPLELDTRSDVYALGVILYELLSHRLPYETKGKLHEIARAIREEDPAPLGTSNRALRGDVETIVSKALEKDVARRYGSAAALAADIRRYLRDEPIAARPASAVYQLQKLASRHKAFVGGVIAVAIALILGAAVSIWQATRATRAERAAELEAAQTGLFAAGRQHVQRALELRERSLGPMHQLTLGSLGDLASIYQDQGDLAEAESLFGKQLDGLRRTLGDTHLDTVTAMNNLALVYRGQRKYGLAEPLQVKVLEIRRRDLGEEHFRTQINMTNLGLTYLEVGKYAEAELLFTKVVEIRRRLAGEEHPSTLDSISNLAGLYFAVGKFDASEELLAQVADIKAVSEARTIRTRSSLSARWQGCTPREGRTITPRGCSSKSSNPNVASWARAIPTFSWR